MNFASKNLGVGGTTFQPRSSYLILKYATTVTEHGSVVNFDPPLILTPGNIFDAMFINNSIQDQVMIGTITAWVSDDWTMRNCR